jgi:predicted signal transduction protein with EAL and GGDEF domain
MLVRQGGDEFLILKPIENLEEITKYLESLIDEEHKEYKINNQKFRISFSIGVVKCPKNVKTIDELLSMADIAMYDAKKRKNSYSFYDEELQRDVLLKADIEQELRGAIKNNEIWIVYQPQLYANNQKIYGVEALVRWENKRLGFVGPDKFISVAEKSGLIVELGEYIFRKSLEEIAALKSELGVDFRLSINISVAQFMQKEFLKRCLKIINEYEFDKKSLTFEVTESMMIEQTDKVLPILNAIKEEGIEISMDDFGTGYSSLSTLHALPIDELKIDKSFIDVILSDTKEELLVESIINIGKNFNMKTLAEGVEDLQQLQKLQELSCDIIQGYYFSKPLKIAALKEYIQER